MSVDTSLQHSLTRSRNTFYEIIETKAYRSHITHHHPTESVVSQAADHLVIDLYRAT
jgi:hypothetical protein